MDVDRCVCCGDYVPEGRHVCIRCANKAPEKITRSITRYIVDQTLANGSCIYLGKEYIHEIDFWSIESCGYKSLGGAVSAVCRYKIADWREGAISFEGSPVLNSYCILKMRLDYTLNERGCERPLRYYIKAKKYV